MAGTDVTRAASNLDGGPAVILVEPQLAENIGMVARAMLNFGLTELRLVRPRDPWTGDKARAAAAGADKLLDDARRYASTEEAVADLSLLYATTARSRDMTKRVVTPRQAAAEMCASAATGVRAGVLFGKEAKGLKNDDVALAGGLVMVPLNPSFGSLNLAMAVLLVGYEWFQAAESTPAAALAIPKDTRPARNDELVGLFTHLEAELERCGFLRVREKRPIMVRNLRNLFGRAQLTEQEVRTLRGVISCLVSGPKT
jgi:tRNA/rRNA methyltransferase